MGYKKPYTIFPRKGKGGKIIYYFRTYDEHGNRTTAQSTGKTTKNEARAYCDQLLKENRLIPSKDITFEEYVKDFFIYEKCPHIQSVLRRSGKYSRSNAKIQRGNLTKHILPAFGKMKIKKISADDIEKWLFSFKKKGLSNVTANNNLKTLRTILCKAEQQDYLDRNPVYKVDRLIDDSKRRSILTKEEALELLDYSNGYWDNDVYLIASKLAACTGMRMGEIQALKFTDIKKHEPGFLKRSYENKSL